MREHAGNSPGIIPVQVLHVLKGSNHTWIQMHNLQEGQQVIPTGEVVR